MDEWMILTYWQLLELCCHVSWQIPYKDEFSRLHIGNVMSVSGLEDLLEVMKLLLLSSLSLKLAVILVIDFCFPIFFITYPISLLSSPTVSTPPSLTLIPHSPPTPSKSLFTQSPISIFYPYFHSKRIHSLRQPLPFFPRVQPTLAGSSPASSWDSLSHPLPPSAPPFFTFLLFSLLQFFPLS